MLFCFLTAAVAGAAMLLLVVAVEHVARSALARWRLFRFTRHRIKVLTDPKVFSREYGWRISIEAEEPRH